MMRSRTTQLLWPEKPSSSSLSSSPSPSSQKRVIGELIHGRDLALQLQTLLLRHKHSSSNASSSSAGEIAGEILRTFTESISALTSAVSVCDDGGASEDSSISCTNTHTKKRSPISSKDGRGCYKRRKGTETWIEVAPTVEDSFSWRKYGQKEILNAKFPRCYFRCSHKPDQGCRATKQVQKMEDDPKVMYHITYIGHHTCKKTLKTPQIIPDHSGDTSYDAKASPHIIMNNQLPPPLFSSGKQELLNNKARSDDDDDMTTLFGPTMFADDVTVGHDIVTRLDHDSNLDDDMNAFVLNFVGFDDADFSTFDRTPTMFSYNGDLFL